MAKTQNYYPSPMYNAYSNYYSVIPTSEFDGKLGGLIGRTIVAIIAFVLSLAVFASVLLLTILEVVDLGTIGLVAGGVLALFGLFFAGAWFYNIRKRWFVRHTRVNGYRLKYTGKTWNLCFRALGWFFCSVFTLFIYALWLPIKTKKWIAVHTVIDEVAPIAEMRTYSQVPTIEGSATPYYNAAGTHAYMTMAR